MIADTIIHGTHFLVSLPFVNATISITNNIKYNIANHVVKLIRILLCKSRLVIYKRGCYSLRFSFKMKVIG